MTTTQRPQLCWEYLVCKAGQVQADQPGPSIPGTALRRRFSLQIWKLRHQGVEWLVLKAHQLILTLTWA